MIKSTVNNNNTKVNERKCTCKNCGNTITKGNGTQIHSQEGEGFICVNCLNTLQRQLNSYSSYNLENGKISTTQKGTKSHEKKTPITNSVEFEISENFTRYGTLKDIAFLEVTEGMKITHDGTVYAEIKTPIYNNLFAPAKQLKNIEKLTQVEKWNNSTDYGTHFNVGSELLNLNYIERFYHSLFVPFSKYLEGNKEKTILLFGRYFTNCYNGTFYYNEYMNGFAQSINYGQDTQMHCNFINMQHSTHIEFRLCKYINNNQYMKCARCCNEIVEKVLIPFCEKFDALNTEQRKKLAEKSSKKMIKIFEKYVAMLINQ